MMTIPVSSIAKTWQHYRGTLSCSPKARAILSMALASAIHFAGYEYARTGTLTLVTSERTGFSNSSVVPFALGFVSPISLLLLWLYARMLDYSGPNIALRNCHLAYALILCLGGLFLQAIDPVLLPLNMYHQCSRFFLFALFVLENGFVQLLFTQHWAFMSSIQTREQAAIWFAPIAGIGSIASTAAAFTVAPLTDYMGLPALLILAGISIGASAFFAMDAYHLAEQHGFEPSPKENEKKTIAKNDGKNLFQRAIALFQRVPLLGALCFEVIFSQAQSSLLNSLFVLKLKDSIPEDDERARYTGNCYACINGFSGVLQFLVLPFLARRLNNRQLWLVMPTIMTVCAVFISLQHAGSIHSVSGSFLLMKAMEYSVRGVTTEMVYVNLDYESRFLGKEIIGVFVNRVGKSLVAIGLSLVTVYFGSQSGLQYLSLALVAVAAGWLLVTYRLTTFLEDSPSKEKQQYRSAPAATSKSKKE
ncbi:expressed unknown protein [Seminavis robusta]|uniref:ADP,ATP carrier protein n=1 Tax=Seminavis robusta TaxID=568900 RepID=A0A9N8HGQ9_9STRA|nr:expressed unknown protein [Seminavis robusta]CAB9509878.1 expressed unknown protein [Seminavis robusta]|eukprot:Sro292_g109740.1 n/a (476) ;mRNA; f:71551-73329